MNKVIIGILAIAIIGGGVLALTGSDETETTATNGNQTTASSNNQTAAREGQQPEANTGTTVPSSGSSTIVEYSAADLASSETDKNILFFHAAWCTVCNSVERNINAASIPDDLTIFKVDYDSDEGQALADKYRIPIQYSMVQVDASGAEITQWVNQFNHGVDDITSRVQQS